MNASSIVQARPQRGVVLILIAALLWGTVGIATKMIYNVSDTNALSIGFIRLALASPALLFACWYARLFPFRIARTDLLLMLVIGVSMALYQVCFLDAIPRIGVTITVLITLCTAPVIVALLAAALLHEPLSLRVVFALVAGLSGTVALSWGGSSAVQSAYDTIIGVGLALGSAIGYAVMTVCSRALSGRYHPLQPMTIGLGTGALILLPFALLSGISISFSPAVWMLLLYLGIVPTALAFVIFLTGIKHTTATIASIITLCEPLVATVLAWLLFGEQLTQFGWIGAFALLGAIGLLYFGTARPIAHTILEQEQVDLP